MAKYRKLRFDYKYGPKNRFYRVVLVKGNPNLFKLGVALLTSVGATFEHCFLFRVEDESDYDTCYVMANFMEDPIPGYKYLGNYKLNDLPNQFILQYDTGDCWDFDCVLEDEVHDLNSHEEDILVLEAVGQGIWEDNSYSLQAYFEGNIDPNLTMEELEDKGILLPWNFDIRKFSSFDKPISIRWFQKEIIIDFKANYRFLLKREKEYIQQSHVNLNDCDSTDSNWYSKYLK